MSEGKQDILICYKVIKLLTNICEIDLEEEDVSQIYAIYYSLAMYISKNIHNKFSETLGNDEEECESIFDEFIEDDEVKEENVNIYDKYEEIVFYFIEYAKNKLNMNYKECMNMNLSELLDYISFNKKYTPEENNENEEDIY